MAQHATHEVFTDTGKVAMRGILYPSRPGRHEVTANFPAPTVAAFQPQPASSHLNANQPGWESPVFDPFFGGTVAI